MIRLFVSTMWELLEKTRERHRQRREELRQRVRQQLKQALHELVAGEEVFLFGSVTRPFAFHDRSDVDIAFVKEPKQSLYGLLAKLEERIQHPVDLIVLSECRFHKKIQREGETWTS